MLSFSPDGRETSSNSRMASKTIRRHRSYPQELILPASENRICSRSSGVVALTVVMHFMSWSYGEPVREVAVIHVQDSDDSYFLDLDHNGRYDVSAQDYTFAYWHASFGDSPAPKIVLRFNGSDYELALDLMRKPVPSKDELKKVVLAIRAGWKSEFPEPLLWKTMLDLIYTGHSDLAWKVVSQAWGSSRGLPRKFLEGFCDQLANSPYFGQLRPTLADAPCDFDPRYGRPM